MEDSHKSALQTKHARLDARIADEKNRPVPDAVLLHDLKKQKLRLKDEIQTVHVPG